MLTHTIGSAPSFTPSRHQAERRTMRPWKAASLVLIALSAVALVTTPHVAPSTSTTPDGVVTSFGSRRSHNGRYTAEVISASPVTVGATQSWTIHISRRTRRVAHASVSAAAWMPVTEDSSSARPSVRYVGGGNYRVDNLLFTKPGWWNVALTIDGSHGTDSLAFNLAIPSTQVR